MSSTSTVIASEAELFFQHGNGQTLVQVAQRGVVTPPLDIATDSLDQGSEQLVLA